MLKSQFVYILNEKCIEVQYMAYLFFFKKLSGHVIIIPAILFNNIIISSIIYTKWGSKYLLKRSDTKKYSATIKAAIDNMNIPVLIITC